MSTVEELLAEYMNEHRAGGKADPLAFLARASPADRRELAAMIDRYLARAPRRDFDVEDFRGSTAERTVDELERVLGGQAGLWPALLPRLRDRAGLRRSQLVDRLAVDLGVGGQRTKVAEYYHQMEQGTLPADGVSDRVLEAIGKVVGETLERLREAGRAVVSPTAGPHTGQAAFARHAYPQAAAPTPTPAAPRSEASELDEVDRLFRAG